MKNSAWTWINDFGLAVCAMCASPALTATMLLFVDPPGCGEPSVWWAWAVPLFGMFIGPLVALRQLRENMHAEAQCEGARI